MGTPQARGGALLDCSFSVGAATRAGAGVARV